jgi:hypothetical protein
MRRKVGYGLVAMGVLAWVPYFGLQWFSDIEPPFAPFLVAHLIGVVGGGWITGAGWIRRLFRGE